MQTRKRIVNAVVGVLAVVLMAAPASAGGAVVTTGDFAVLSGGEGTYDGVAGTAQMVRTPSGMTIVRVNASGLISGETYGSHVHVLPCTEGGGGHYNFGHAVSGGVGPGDAEIWPGPFTANAADHANGRAKVGDIAGATAVSVVIHAPDGTKIACADLS